MIVFFVVLVLYYTLKKTNETFQNKSQINSASKNAKYLLLNDSFPVTNDPNKLTDNQYSTIWWRYPSFKPNSYRQITNNIRYSNNPDNGLVSPAEFAGAFYKDHQTRSNYIKMLPPVPINNQRRVNYYLSKT
jgi:hypothetical protein